MNSKHDVMNRALSRIESFLLPTSNDNKLNLPSTNNSEIPTKRLEETLFQVSLADHIRIMQTMYRDNHDEQNLGGEFRIDVENIKLPIKYLMNKIVEGRTRTISLIKIAYSENTPALLKGQLDLANAYAIQGMWPQVEEKITLMNELLRKIHVTAMKAYDLKFLLAKMAAERLCCVYDTLREHAISNHGLISKQYVKEVLVLLMNIHSQSDRSTEAFLGHPSRFATSLLTLFIKTTHNNYTKKAYTESYYHDKDKAYSTEESIGNSKELSKSWGEVVEFLRDHCDSIRIWLELIDDVLLPQNKAVLLLPFTLCDLQRKHIAHPMQLADTLLSFPTTAKVLIGSKLPKLLSKIKVEVPLLIDSKSGSVVDLHQDISKRNAFSNQNVNYNSMNTSSSIPSSQQVNYELPITREEFLALYIISTSSAVQNQIELLKVQMYTIQGIYYIYTENLESAEEYLKKALNILESLGMEMDIVACELYNSIAQMMILKHRNWLTTRKSQVREEADLWLETNEGKRALRLELKSIKQQYDYKSPLFVTSGEIEMRAKINLVRIKMSELLNHSEESKKMNNILQAAYRYLVRSMEILESVHGTSHPSVGTACLAVASVQNILENYEDTREWLMRALKNMERCQPIPHRAISFTKIQLSQVLTKLGYEDQARMLLASAASFHMSQAQVGLLQLSNTGHINSNSPKKQNNVNTSTNTDFKGIHPESISAPVVVEDSFNYSIVSPLIFNDSPLNEEINAAIDIMSKVMRLSTKANDKWNAAIQAEEIAKLIVTAYGWDSLQAAEAYKQAGIRCAAIQDWNRAYKYLKESLDAMLLLFGKSDGRTVEIAKLLYSAKKYRSNDTNQQDIKNKVINNDKDNYEIDLVNHIKHHENLIKNQQNDDMIVTITTPRTIELQPSNHIEKDAIDLMEKSPAHTDIVNIDLLQSMIKAANI